MSPSFQRRYGIKLPSPNSCRHRTSPCAESGSIMLVSTSALVLSMNYLTSALPSRHLPESSQDPGLKRLTPSAPLPTLSPTYIPTNLSSMNEFPTCWPPSLPPDPPVWPITHPSDCGAAIRLIISEHGAMYALLLIPLTNDP